MPRALREARRQRKNRDVSLNARDIAWYFCLLSTCSSICWERWLCFRVFSAGEISIFGAEKKREFWGGRADGRGERAGKTGGHHERRREGAGLVGGPSEAEEESSGVAEPARLHVEEEAGGAPRAGAVPGGKQKTLAGRGNALEKWCRSVVEGKGQRGDADGSRGRGDRARRSKASEARQG